MNLTEEHTPDEAPQYAVIELMGHVVMAGLIGEEERFGGVMARLISPRADGQSVVRYFNRSSLYRMTLCDEKTALMVTQHGYLPTIGYFDDDECARLARRAESPATRSQRDDEFDESDPFANE